MRFLGTKLDVIDVCTGLQTVVSLDPGEVVRPLEAALDTVLRREGLAAEEGKAGNIYTQAAAPGKLREAIVQAAARKLEAGGVEKRLTENRVVLEDAGDIAGLLQGSPRARILTKILVLRVDLNACHQRWRHADAQERAVLCVPVMVEAPRPQARAFFHRIVTAQRVQAHVRAW